ncbi:MAG: hypothetical protein A2219_00480 [Elusimicrobia bacterium RIFOXYA2_FULL_50_26]|nr:MAG: hypothetical protein A2219_00480 [Elusimicrobia bacterium RIFOXYA2_FULL_50_26]OGS24676.1 MAG: hypothetical protein A2314_03800 [Elusimicrobia bacterium RIFOXYB2_FULL_50_12]
MVMVDSAAYAFGVDGMQFAAPSLNNETITCAWDVVSGVRVTQDLSIVKGKGTRNKDTIKIKYTITNAGAVAHNVALRLQMDTLLGENDGAPFRVMDYGEVTTDKEWDDNDSTESPAIPQFCHVFDNLSNPSIFSMITLNDIGYRSPDRFVLGYWPEAYSSWDYTIDPTRSFLDNDNNGTISGSSPDSDSSAIVWWGYSGGITLAPGESVELAILYGLSNMNFVTWSPLNIGLTSPAELEADTELVSTFMYLPSPFVATAYLSNSSQDTVTGATVRINLPPEFYLDEGEQATKYVEETPGSRTVAAGKAAQVSWKVKTYGRYTGNRLFSVTANAGGGSKTVSRTIYLPGIADAVFGQVTDKDNNPVAGASVELFAAGQLLSTVLTASDGTYIFESLPHGLYEIKISYTGYAPVVMAAEASGESRPGNAVLIESPGVEFQSFSYPNPAREGNVRIRFYTEQARSVKVQIFDSVGGLIKTMSVSSNAGGWTEATWNIDDVSNGVYFYRIDYDGTIKTGKIAVIKKKVVN